MSEEEAVGCGEEVGKADDIQDAICVYIKNGSNKLNYLIFFEDPKPTIKFNAAIRLPLFEIVPSKFLPKTRVNALLNPIS